MGLASNCLQIKGASIFVDWMNARLYFLMYLRRGDPHRTIQRIHLHINREAMVKEQEAGHINLNLPGWAVLMPLTSWSLLGFLLCNHCSFLSLSFLLSSAELTSWSNLFGFHHVLTWTTPAISLLFILLFYYHLLSAESTWVYSFSGSFRVINLGRVPCPLCTIPSAAVTTPSVLFCSLIL